MTTFFSYSKHKLADLNREFIFILSQRQMETAVDEVHDDIEMVALTATKKRRYAENAGPRDFSNVEFNGMTFETKSCKNTPEGTVKNCVCVNQRKNNCPAAVQVTKSVTGTEIKILRKHTCDLLTVAPRKHTGVCFDETREPWNLSAYSPRMRNFSRGIKVEIDRLLGKCRASLSCLTGCKGDRFYIPNFYDLDASPDLIELREYLLLVFNEVIQEMKKRHRGLRHFRIGLIVSYPGAASQGVVHYDYDSSLRELHPDYRAMSCLMAIDGFGFTFLGENDKWQEIWCPEGTWLSFTDGCLHFGSENSFSRYAVRAFLYCTSFDVHLPNGRVFIPERTSYPDPKEKVYRCKEDQDPGFEWTFLA